MKIKLLSVILCALLISGCNQSGGSEPEKYTSIELDFTIKHTAEEGIPSTGDTGKMDVLVTALNKYYINDENMAITEMTGGFLQIQNGFDVTATRNVPQMMILGSRNASADITMTFANLVKRVTFVCEAYSKYISYSSTQNVDRDTSLTVNGVKKDITAHKAEDIDETQTLQYKVNSETLTINVPNKYVGDTKVQRIMVYKMILEY